MLLKWSWWKMVTMSIIRATKWSDWKARKWIRKCGTFRRFSKAWKSFWRSPCSAIASEVMGFTRCKLTNSSPRFSTVPSPENPDRHGIDRDEQNPGKGQFAFEKGAMPRWNKPTVILRFLPKRLTRSRPFINRFFCIWSLSDCVLAQF